MIMAMLASPSPLAALLLGLSHFKEGWRCNKHNREHPLQETASGARFTFRGSDQRVSAHEWEQPPREPMANAAGEGIERVSVHATVPFGSTVDGVKRRNTELCHEPRKTNRAILPCLPVSEASISIRL
jgi:hypothetical protein